MNFKKLAFNIYEKNKTCWPSEFDNFCTRIQSCSNTISLYYEFILYNYQLVFTI